MAVKRKSKETKEGEKKVLQHVIGGNGSDAIVCLDFSPLSILMILFAGLL